MQNESPKLFKRFSQLSVGLNPKKGNSLKQFKPPYCLLKIGVLFYFFNKKNKKTKKPNLLGRSNLISLKVSSCFLQR